MLLGLLYRHKACGIASSGVVRFVATSLESVELVSVTLLERNSDHDAHLKRGVGYVRRSCRESRVVVAGLFQHTLNLRPVVRTVPVS